MFKDLMEICKYFNSLNFGEIAAKCKKEIESYGLLTDKVLKILEEPVTCADVFDCGFPWAQFQLNYLGRHLERRPLGAFDEELGFAPDVWQSEIITVIRNRQSAVVVAPSSSGKTYASYYCMKSVLKESVDGVVVHVSPTNALVKQEAATVYARFKNTNMPDGMRLVTILTEVTQKNFENSQILVTNPKCLEILLLSPKHTQWVKRLRYIIFDEIHSLSGIASGSSWESGLLLSKCPFLVLSSTIEKPQVLEQWLKGAAKYKKERDVADGSYDKGNNRNYEVELIIHTECHNDLEKHLFADGKLSHIHPYTFLTRKIILQHGVVPKTLTLSPKETLQLYRAINVVVEEEIAHLTPEVFFSSISPNGFITKQQVRSFESALNDKLYDLAQGSPSDFKIVITHLSGENQVANQSTMCSDELFDLVDNLSKNKMLPAIIFSYNRDVVESMFNHMTDAFGSKSPTSDDVHPLQMRDFRKGKKLTVQDKNIFSSLNLVSVEKSMGVADSDDLIHIEDILRKDKLRSDSPFVCGLRCGVGMHHGGLSKNQRMAVEMLFRMKLLNVIFASGSLILGINMPCKTVVIAGEKRHLTVFSYHQMAGRADEGNLVFWNVSHSKISKLMTEKLPGMWVNIPMAVSVILRLLVLASGGFSGARQTEEERKWNVSRALTFLNCNLVYQSFPDLRQQMKHYFAFSNQLLMVQQLVDEEGNPRAMADLVTRLHHHEPGNLVFVYLLHHGVFNKICKKENGKISKQTELDLVLVLSHLFTYTPLHKYSLQQKFNNSRVVLHKMPDFVVREIEKYNEEVLLVFDNYFKSVAKDYQHQADEANSLPLSAVSFIPDSAYPNPLPSSLEKKLFGNVEERLICSSFAALSGHGDDCKKSLFSTIRHEVFTDMKILPYFNLNQQLNSYAWDFYNHGLRKSIKTDNSIKEGSSYFKLQDFLHILETLHTCLTEFSECGENDTVVEVFREVYEKFSALFEKSIPHEKVLNFVYY